MSDFSFLISTSALNVTLLAFAAECRAVTSAAAWAAGVTVYARRSAQTHCTSGMRSHDGTDRWMDTRSSHLHRLCFVYYAYSTYQQLPVNLAWCHNTLSFPTTIRHTPSHQLLSLGVWRHLWKSHMSQESTCGGPHSCCGLSPEWSRSISCWDVVYGWLMIPNLLPRSRKSVDHLTAGHLTSDPLNWECWC